MTTQTNATVVLHGTKEYKKLDKDLKGLLERAWAKSDEKEVSISYADDKYDFITVVKETAKSARDWRDFGGTYYNRYAKTTTSITFDIDNKNVDDIAEGVRLAEYNFTKYKTGEEKTAPTVHFTKDSNGDIWKSVYFARDLITEPGNVLYPEEYAQRIYETLTPMGVVVKIIPQKMLERMGFDLLLSVGQGSVKDSQVVIMEWMQGGKKPTKALVGKGVTFDTGGISLKPSAGMGDMKYDMGGSAAVVGAMHAIASKGVKENVVGIVGLVENMPDGNAIKPGDVVKSFSGMTVENLNTDAEGRLVLADILTHVQREYSPGLIIDLATLTGAIVAALGNDIAGLFTNSSELGNTIDALGSNNGEHFWRMPMGQDWNKMLDSQIADMKNISGGRNGGATTAAEFLYRFVDSKTPWAHLDIAGVCWDEKGKPTVPAGAVGFGVRTLLDLVKEDTGRFEIDEDMNY
jgi:leucyl aminopeptidase